MWAPRFPFAPQFPAHAGAHTRTFTRTSDDEEGGVDGTPIDLDKFRSIGVISRRSRPRVAEGRAHPETGRPWKATTTEAGTVTEHNTRDDRVDALVTPQTVPMSEALAERIRPHGNG